MDLKKKHVTALMLGLMITSFVNVGRALAEPADPIANKESPVTGRHLCRVMLVVLPDGSVRTTSLDSDEGKAALAKFRKEQAAKEKNTKATRDNVGVKSTGPSDDEDSFIPGFKTLSQDSRTQAEGKKTKATRDNVGAKGTESKDDDGPFIPGLKTLHQDSGLKANH